MYKISGYYFRSNLDMHTQKNHKNKKSIHLISSMDPPRKLVPSRDTFPP